MGQGANTKVAQTAAHVLGIPMDMISVKPSNSLTAPNAILTGGNFGSEISCHVSKIYFNLFFGQCLMFYRPSKKLAKSCWND